jgi:hypothetical protein
MKNNTISPTLKALIAEKADVCVSMIIPLHEIPSFKKMDTIVVDHAISKLRALMEPVYDANIVKEFIEKIKYLKDDIKYINGVKGIGIFISEKTFHTETFPFEVKEKIHAGTSFEVRDLLYREIHLREYLVLSLTGHEVKLYKGRGTTLKEVQDKNFPAVFYEHDYAAPVLEQQVENQSQTMKRHKSEIMESTKSFHNTMDKKLLDYLHGDQALLITGTEKEMASFEAVTVHRDKIKGKITGNYEQYNFAELETKCCDAMQKIQHESEQQIISSLNELFGKELVAIGIRDVWRNAKSGKGNVLVLEKDLMIPGFLADDEYQLWLSPPKEKHRIITDAVDDVIESVIEKNGKVVFVEDGSLKEFAGIAMINRY